MLRPLALLTVASTACVLPRRSPEPAPSRQSLARDSLFAVDQSRNDSIARHGLVATMRSMLDPQVIYLRAGAVTSYGSERALKLLQSPQPQAASFTAWQPIGGGLSKDQLSGFTFGIAVRATPELPGAMIERYIAYWSRVRGGPWRISGYIEVSPGRLSTAEGDPARPGEIPERSRPLIAADSQLAERASSLVPAAALRDAVSDDGVLLSTTQLIVGPAAAADYFESRRSFSLSWVPRDGRIAASGDLGFTIGEGQSTSLGPTGAATQRFSKYLTVWRHENGKWRIVVTGANDRPSPVGN
jgi:ketosteroid isomerase-like protein